MRGNAGFLVEFKRPAAGTEMQIIMAEQLRSVRG
jgi:hypothetical protein